MGEILASRAQCDLGNFAGAVEILDQATSASHAVGEIEADIVRIHIIRGDRAAAARQLKVKDASPAPATDTAPFLDILSLQKAYLGVSERGDLASAVLAADSMWEKYGIGSPGDSAPWADEVAVGNNRKIVE